MSRPLRRQLFRSHLVVIFAAMGGIVVLAVVLGFIFEYITGWPHFGSGRGGNSDEESFGPFVLLGIGTAAVGAASFVGFRMARRLAEPMETLGVAARQMAEGNYDVSVDATGVDELDALGADVQTLARGLAETEARRLRLIGDIAHELRTPLSTIEGSMEALMDGVVRADDETYAGIAREAARLRRLADDLSALSSSAEQDPMVDAVDVDLAALARTVGDLLHVQADAKGLELFVEAGAPVFVRGNPDRLAQVLTNIVGNAVQYTDEGRVAVRVATADGQAVIDVADTGRGLSAADQERVFERFYRTDENYADGSGVGLTIARQLVWAHGGTIAVASPGAGRGTMFTVRLPLASSSEGREART